MKRLLWVFAGLITVGSLSGCASYFASQAPMTRAARSTFQPFITESGEARFVTENTYFSSESSERNSPYFSAWLQEWLLEYDYCRNGYDVMWTKTEPFVAIPTLGGHLVTMARCK